jgi:hypothetical protein
MTEVTDELAPPFRPVLAPPLPRTFVPGDLEWSAWALCCHFVTASALIYFQVPIFCFPEPLVLHHVTTLNAATDLLHHFCDVLPS